MFFVFYFFIPKEFAVIAKIVIICQTPYIKMRIIECLSLILLQKVCQTHHSLTVLSVFYINLPFLG